MDRGAWEATVPGVTKVSDTTQWLNNNNSKSSSRLCPHVGEREEKRERVKREGEREVLCLFLKGHSFHHEWLFS